MRQRFYDGIRADDARAQQEIDRMNREGSDLVKEYKNLVATSKDPAVSAENRAEAQAAAAAKLDTIRKKQQDIRAFTEATALSVQWQRSAELRVALQRAQSDADEFGRLRDENRRLRTQQISTAELERLRSDHAALPRLRAELEALQHPPPAPR